VKILLDGLDHDDPAIRYECLNALRRITDKDLGVDPAAWRKELDPQNAPRPAAATRPESLQSGKPL